MTEPHGLTAGMSKRLTACGAPSVLFDVLAYLHKTCKIDRNLHMVEFFSGVGNLHREFDRDGLRTVHFELAEGPDMDLLSTTGLLKAVKACLRLRPGGLAWFGTPCSSFVWVNRFTSGRTLSEPLGNVGLRYVQQANQLAGTTALLAMLVSCQHCFFAIEQPASSLLEAHPRVKALRAPTVLLRCDIYYRLCWHLLSLICFRVKVDCLVMRVSSSGWADTATGHQSHPDFMATCGLLSLFGGSRSARAQDHILATALDWL